MLDEVLKRADVEILTSPASDVRVCSYQRWPGVRFEVRAVTADLERWLAIAAQETEHLWPGREGVDGAISLFAISLSAHLDVRMLPASSVSFEADGLWTVFPKEIQAQSLGTDGHDWRAAPPRVD